MMQVGDPAPDFLLMGSNGAEVRLSDLKGKQPAVLVFYVKDSTPG